MASIFVQIASYHDFELPKTLIHAVKQMSGNHQVNFGVFNCYYKFNDVYIPDIPNLKIIEKMAPDGIGVGQSRNIASSLYSGEDYYFQIDAHTRFEKNWDEFLISEIKRYKECGVKKPLITTYPGTYRYDNELNEVIDWGSSTTRILLDDISGDFAKHLTPGQKASVPDGYSTQSSVSAGFIFTVGEFAAIDFNDKIVFWGEEILIAAKAWTSGFDLLMPSKQAIYHLYYDQDNRMQKSNRRHIWKDFGDIFYEKDALSKKEIEQIFSKNIISKEGLGSERTLNDFGKYSGLNFTDRTVSTI